MAEKEESTTTSPSLPKGEGATQQKLFENLPDEQTPDQSSSNTINKKPVESKEPSTSDKQPVTEDGTSTASIVADIPTAPQRSSRSSKKQLAAKKSTRRKFHGSYVFAQVQLLLEGFVQFPAVQFSPDTSSVDSPNSTAADTCSTVTAHIRDDNLVTSAYDRPVETVADA